MYSLNPAWFNNYRDEQKKKRMEILMKRQEMAPVQVVTLSNENKVKVVEPRRNSSPSITPYTLDGGRDRCMVSSTLGPSTFCAEVFSTKGAVTESVVSRSRGVKRKWDFDCEEACTFAKKQRCTPESRQRNPSFLKRKKKGSVEVIKLNKKQKKPRVETVEMFGRNLSRKELDDEVFKFVRLCRVEADCNNPKFFERLAI